LTIAGGVTTAEEIAMLDRLGVDAQVGMALYTDRLDLGAAVAAPFITDRADGLIPTVVVDESHQALGLAWSSPESLRQAVNSRAGIYHSRRRGLWRKGETSGAGQDLLRVDADCDRDTVRFTVRQHGAGFCHLGTLTCWGAASPMGDLARTLAARRTAAPQGSYTRRLLDDPELLAAKVKEEAEELAAAVTGEEVLGEAADLCYFLMVRLTAAGLDLGALQQELARRSRRISRRPGDAKPAPHRDRGDA
jgi:phosphoribosyl-ATP pyrophosphohydrolase